MKVFISWSGKPSLNVATALREWLPYIFNGIELFVSSEDIRKGKRWPLEVSKELDVSNFGIVCLTPDNLEAPWLLFESGALSKSLKEASVYTLLVGGLRVSDIEGPLSHFQHTVFEREDFFKLVKCMNEAQGAAKQEEPRLRKIFDKFWDELETSVAKAVKTDSRPERKRSTEDMLRELLETTGYIARQIPKSTEPVVLRDLHPRSVIRTDEALWATIIDKSRKASPFLKSYLIAAKAYFSDGTLLIDFPPECEEYALMVNNDRNIKLLQRILSELGFGDSCKVIVRPVPTEAVKEKSSGTTKVHLIRAQKAG